MPPSLNNSSTANVFLSCPVEKRPHRSRRETITKHEDLPSTPFLHGRYTHTHTRTHTHLKLVPELLHLPGIKRSHVGVYPVERLLEGLVLLGGGGRGSKQEIDSRKYIKYTKYMK